MNKGYMTIEELSELTDWNASPEGIEPETPLAKGKKFRPVAFEFPPKPQEPK